MKTAEQWDEEAGIADAFDEHGRLVEFVRAVQRDAIESVAKLCDDYVTSDTEILRLGDSATFKAAKIRTECLADHIRILLPDAARGVKP